MGCTGDTTGIAVGIGNEPTEGAPSVLAIVFVACIGGTPTYTTNTMAGGDTDFGSSSAGDLIYVSMTQTPKKVTATLRNKTTAQTVQSSGTPTPDNSLIFGSLPLFAGPKLAVPDFGSMQVVRPYLENSPLSAWSPTRVNRSTGGTLQISTTNFSPSGSFRIDYVAP